VQFKPLNGLFCADVPLRNYSLTWHEWRCICAIKHWSGSRRCFRAPFVAYVLFSEWSLSNDQSITT